MFSTIVKKTNYGHSLFSTNIMNFNYKLDNKLINLTYNKLVARLFKLVKVFKCKDGYFDKKSV